MSSNQTTKGNAMKTEDRLMSGFLAEKERQAMKGQTMWAALSKADRRRLESADRADAKATAAKARKTEETKRNEMSKYLYVNNKNQDLRAFHSVIVEAIKNGGVFGEDYADILKLRKTPEGSRFEWALEMAE